MLFILSASYSQVSICMASKATKCAAPPQVTKLEEKASETFSCLFWFWKEQFAFILIVLSFSYTLESILPKRSLQLSSKWLFKSWFLKHWKQRFHGAFFFSFRYFGWNCRHDLTAWLLLLCRYLFTRMILASRTKECQLSRKDSVHTMGRLCNWMLGGGERNYSPQEMKESIGQEIALPLTCRTTAREAYLTMLSRWAVKAAAD